MKNSVITLFIIFYAFPLFAQEVVSSAGETNTIAGYEVSWTVGEPVIATLSNGTNTVTQGFQQSKLIVTAISEIADLNFEFRVFPNPTHDFVIIQMNKIFDTTNFALFNSAGQEIQNGLIRTTQTKIDLNNLASGQYVLQLKSKPGKLIQSFKIIKN